MFGYEIYLNLYESQVWSELKDGSSHFTCTEEVTLSDKEGSGHQF